MRSSCRLSQSLRCLRSSSSVTLGTPSTAVVLRRLPAPCLGSNRIKWHLKESRRASSLVQTDEPTIYALSTAPGRAAIAIIRVSGPAWLSVYQALCPGKPLPKPRSATLRSLHETGSASVEAQVLDSGALILYFPAPETSTGEDVLELHVHGGTAVVKAVLAAIPRSIPKQRLQLIRYAEPGEFTRRAFYNNRLDLLQIEALGDTLAADTEQQRRLAVRGSTSVLADRYDSWRQRLLYARGELEALIDFSEDQHFDETPTKLCASVAKQIQELRSQLKANIEGASRGELLRSGISIALVGAPNVGKSSLFNQIVGREAAIVSSEAGTTRDVVDVNVDIGGYFCRFGDLAGLRKQAESSGQIEREGMRRAKQRALTSDVVIAVLSATQEGSEVDVHVDPEVLEVLSKRNVERQRVVFVLNKADLFVHARSADDALARLRSHDAIDNLSGPSALTLFAVSCKDAQAASSDAPNSGGIQALLDGLTQLFEDMTITVLPEGQGPAGSNSAWAESLGATERQRLLLQQSLQHLETFLAELRAVSSANGGDVGQGDDGVDVVLAAESLRSAADCLAKVIGRGEAGDVEEVLGVVFEKSVF